jgi:succinate dehydrogenase flavin-adding protein (antitoxin of CptAB toxin-antitoxin module)
MYIKPLNLRIEINSKFFYKMISYITANSQDHLEGILKLQSENLINNISVDEAASQGFLTVQHNFEILKKLNDTEQHIIAVANNEVVGFTLSMTAESKHDVPMLYPMFLIFDEITYNQKKVSDYNYIVVGQACISKDYRGMRVLDNCYNNFKNYHHKKYDFAITEIAKKNLRSLTAHQRVGFKVLDEFTDPNGIDWIIVIWDWNKTS